jgi:hypothetical protein
MDKKKLKKRPTVIEKNSKGPPGKGRDKSLGNK